MIFTNDDIKGLNQGQISNYGKFICNIFGWDTVKIDIIKAKV